MRINRLHLLALRFSEPPLDNRSHAATDSESLGQRDAVAASVSDAVPLLFAPFLLPLPPPRFDLLCGFLFF